MAGPANSQSSGRETFASSAFRSFMTRTRTRSDGSIDVDDRDLQYWKATREMRTWVLSREKRPETGI